MVRPWKPSSKAMKEDAGLDHGMRSLPFFAASHLMRCGMENTLHVSATASHGLAARKTRLILAGELDGGFVGLRSGVAEEDAVGEGRLHQRARQRRPRLTQVQVADMAQHARLLTQRVLPPLVAVAQHVHRDAGHEVQIWLICDTRHASALPSTRQQSNRLHAPLVS
jgi:hypothetical protein